jgi:hypothetical protein
MEVKPVLAEQAVRSCVPVWFEYVAAVAAAPWSEPAKEPVTVVVPPALGRMNPSPPAASEAAS